MFAEIVWCDVGVRLDWIGKGEVGDMYWKGGGKGGKVLR